MTGGTASYGPPGSTLANSLIVRIVLSLRSSLPVRDSAVYLARASHQQGFELVGHEAHQPILDLVEADLADVREIKLGLGE